MLSEILVATPIDVIKNARCHYSLDTKTVTKLILKGLPV